ATVQAFGMVSSLASQNALYSTGLSVYILAAISLIAGSMFMMWLGEQITERGIGNGVSMLIFAGIVAGLPAAVGQSLEQARQGDLNVVLLLGIAVGVPALIYAIVF